MNDKPFGWGHVILMLAQTLAMVLCAMVLLEMYANSDTIPQRFCVVLPADSPSLDQSE